MDYVYLLDGYDVQEHDGERHVFVRNIEELHKAIGLHIISRRKGLTRPEIRFLRNTLDQTQNEMARELGNSAQSIARWEKGQIEIPADAEKVLRVCYFAKLAEFDDPTALRDFIVKKLSEIDEIDEIHTTAATFMLDGLWTENVSEMAYS